MTQPASMKRVEIRNEINLAGLRFRDREETLGITLHCMATPPTHNWGAIEVDRLHRSKGWLCIGYHFVIDRDGVIHQGRPVGKQGAHCKHGGRNKTHIGTAMAGGIDAKGNSEMNFTDAQWEAQEALIRFIQAMYPNITDGDVEGHRDVKGVRKDCPCFNTRKLMDEGIRSFR